VGGVVLTSVLPAGLTPAYLTRILHGVTWTGISTSECPGLVTMCNKVLCPFYPINGSGIPVTFDPTASHASA
jgi:hypothetical protein